MKKIFAITIGLAVIIAFTGCKKIPDKIPTRDLRDGVNYSVAQLRNIAACSVGSCQNKRFIFEAYLKGVVLADDVCGNFYKELYVRDAANTGAIHFTFLFNGCNIHIGDSVRINLKGYNAGINTVTGVLEIDSVDFEKSLVKYASGADPEPKQIILSALSGTNNYGAYYGDLITINNVGFLPSDTNQIYADPIKQLSFNRTIRDCGLRQIVVRTSNYAIFAQQKTPGGYGTITGIATSYNGTDQMAIRSHTEVSMTGPGCTIFHVKNFNDASLTSGGWTQKSVINGSVLWTASSFNTSKFAKISGFVSGNQNSENWLISPALNLSASSNPVLTFVTAAKFAGNNLEVWASANYTSGLPSTAIWTQLTGFSLSPNNPGSYVWIPSGNISLNNFKTAAARIAFKYTSTTAGATTYEVDDVIIREN
jgi:hypothetical protein